MTRALALFSTLLISTTLCPSAARADVPQKMTYAGTLTDSAGTPITGSRDFRLLFCSTVANGHCNVPLLYDSGLAFSNYLLGPGGTFQLEMDPVTASAINNLTPEAWIEVLVNASGSVDLVTVGIQKMSAVPYAYRSVTAENALSAQTAVVAQSVDYANVQNVPDPPTCSPGRFLTWNGSAYFCLTPSGFSSVAAPLVVTGEQLTLPTLDITRLVGTGCGAGEVVAHDGTAFVCLQPSAGPGIRVVSSGNLLNYSVDFSDLCGPNDLIAADPTDMTGYSCIGVGAGLTRAGGTLAMDRTDNDGRYVNTDGAGDSMAGTLTLSNAVVSLIAVGPVQARAGLRVATASGRALIIDDQPMGGTTRVFVESNGAMSINSAAAAGSVFNGAADTSSMGLRVGNSSADVLEPTLEVSNASTAGRVARFMEGTTPRVVINGSTAAGANVAEFGSSAQASISNTGIIRGSSFVGDGAAITNVTAEQTTGRAGGASFTTPTHDHARWRNNATRFNMAAAPNVTTNLGNLSSDGRRIWVTGTGQFIYKVDAASGAATSMDLGAPSFNSNANSVFDGRYLNVAPGTGTTVKRVDTLAAAGDVATSAITITGATAGVLAFDGVKMWNFGFDPFISSWTPGVTPTVTVTPTTGFKALDASYAPGMGMFVLNDNGGNNVVIHRINTTTGAIDASSNTIGVTSAAGCSLVAAASHVVLACGTATANRLMLFNPGNLTTAARDFTYLTGQTTSEFAWQDVDFDGRFIVAMDAGRAHFLDITDLAASATAPAISRTKTINTDPAVGLSFVIFDGEQFFASSLVGQGLIRF